MIKGMAQYFRGVRAEFGKVSWPSRQQFINSFIAVVAGVVIVALISGAFDTLLQGILTKKII